MKYIIILIWGYKLPIREDEWEERGFDYGDTEQITSTVCFPNDIEVLGLIPFKQQQRQQL